MKYINDILKISIFLLLLAVCLGSVYAADNVQSDYDDISDDGDNLDFDEDLGEFDSEDDSNLDDDGLDDDDNLDEDDDNLDEDDDNLDEDDDNLDEDDDGLDEDGDENLEDIDDENETEDSYTDFEYLHFKIRLYLERYGNCSDYNWTESDAFLREYQLYLTNSSDYSLNRSAEGYETYLKIYDSITSTFKDYNLTENETAYLKFMVIFYLNHYGNVSANYTWNESESFENFTPYFDITGCVLSKATFIPSGIFNGNSDLFTPVYAAVPGNSTDVNATASNSQMNVPPQQSLDVSVIILIFLIAVMFFILI